MNHRRDSLLLVLLLSASWCIVECRIFGFGANDFGTLGVGDITERHTPTSLAAFETIVPSDLSSGGHTALFVVSGKVYGIGENDNYQLGLGADNVNRYTPVLITGNAPLSSVTFAQVAGGHFFSGALGGKGGGASNGNVYLWGANDCSRFGKQESVLRTTPTLFNYDIAIKQLALGGVHTIMLGTNGRVYTMGCNDNGQLGTGDANGRATPSMVMFALSTAYVTAIGKADLDTLALTSEGRVYAFGDNVDGQLGTGDTTKRLTPFLIPLSTLSIQKILPGYFHTMLLTDKGRVYGLGNNEFGQLALGGSDGVSRYTPTLVKALSTVSVVGGSCGYHHCLMFGSDSRLYTLGSNSAGQLGVGDNLARFTPSIVLGELSRANPVLAAAGYDKSILITDSQINECGWGFVSCASIGGLCSKNSTNNYACSCSSGYSGNGFSCVDIDECSSLTLNTCSGNATCANFAGGFSCTCNSGFVGDGVTCAIPVPTTAPPPTTPAATSTESSSDTNVGAIVGGVVGGVGGAILIIVVIILIGKSRKSSVAPVNSNVKVNNNNNSSHLPTTTVTPHSYPPPSKMAPSHAMAAPPPLPELEHTYDAFLSHNWGINQDNHQRVSKINQALKKRGVRTWFDEERMEGEINLAMTQGVDASTVFVAFVTPLYIEKLQREDDNCSKEFGYASRKKGSRAIIPVVLDKACSNPGAWGGQLGFVSGGTLIKNMFLADDIFGANSAAFEEQVDRLRDEILHRCAVIKGEVTSAGGSTPIVKGEEAV